MDYLSQMTDDTLERRKEFVPQAQQIIEEIKTEFDQWLQNRRFAPIIQALKQSLETIKEGEIDFQRKKIADFNQPQTSAPEQSLSLIKEVFEL